MLCCLLLIQHKWCLTFKKLAVFCVQENPIIQVNMHITPKLDKVILQRWGVLKFSH